VLGNGVRQRRTALGLTKEQCEAASGVPHGSISRIESGVAEDVHASTVVGFAKALHVSADYHLGLKE
jgi:transcriptional regulator with XRE-family HTH domain